MQDPPEGYTAVSEDEAKKFAAAELRKTEKKKTGGSGSSGGDGGESGARGTGGGSSTPTTSPAAGEGSVGALFLGSGPQCSCAGKITGDAIAAAGLTAFFCIEPAKI